MTFKGFAAALFLGAYSFTVFGAYGDMDLGTCAPSGVINKAKAAMSPKAFWVKMYLDSLEAIEYQSGRKTDDQWGGPAEHCSINNQIGTSGYAACMLRERNTLEYWVKCNRYAKFMCNQSGGHC